MITTKISLPVKTINFGTAHFKGNACSNRCGYGHALFLKSSTDLETCTRNPWRSMSAIVGMLCLHGCMLYIIVVYCWGY